MGLTEKWVEQHATRTPEEYAARVRWIAAAYSALFIVSLAVMVTDAWRIRYFITLAARSNADTAVLALIFILAAYYVVTSSRGIWGALRILRWSRGSGNAQERKHAAIRTGGSSKYVCFDQAVRLEGQPDKPIRWNVGDGAGKLGELQVDAITATYYPLKDGMSNGIFEFLADQLANVLRKQDPQADLHIVRWSSIDDDNASRYQSTVQAFHNMGARLGAGAHSIWPTVEISADEVAEIGEALRKLVPALREEAFLPDFEYQVEYSVPIIPEPLAFVQLKRSENRADPLVTIGAAAIIMLLVLLMLVGFIVLPPWIPSR